jgi:hypothetical protein
LQSFGLADTISKRCTVVSVLESKREAIAKLCARYGVARLEVFGSALRDDFRRDKSDLDLLVEFAPMEPYARVDAYFGMLDDLRALLNREIDLVMTGAVKNPYLARDIERTKQLLYAA